MIHEQPEPDGIFGQAIHIASPQEREKYLTRACGENAQLRAEVDELLAAYPKAENFLEKPAAVPSDTVDRAMPSERAGSKIGPYKLIQQIGDGGMGVVYMAQQTEPVKRMVALKVIKPGMDSKQVIARFEAERQALALMDHPNIAKVLDAGTTDAGRPYFVMELVKGVPITTYCDEHQLSPRERMELFVPICQAIQHAHQKGIIHRDLKPSNVLIASYDGRPVPKVIDFGVVKAIGQQLTERTLFTGFGGIVGTLEYMSPEQAEFNALDIDTRSDIYSLGVMLYELLTGSTPLTKQQLKQVAITEVLRLIREQEPPKPSTRLSNSAESLASISAQRKLDPAKLMNVVTGELDWIVMKALEKDRLRRYDTPHELARDIERFLQDEPVEACPPTVGYRLRKFARKQHRLLTTAACFALLFVAAFVAVAWQAYRASVAEQHAEHQRRDAEEQGEKAMLAERDATAEARRAHAMAEEARRSLYISQMNLAQAAWEDSHLGSVRELLRNSEVPVRGTDLRGFEWYYWKRLANASQLSLEGHSSEVLDVTFSPDGKRMASASWDRTIKVWDAASGAETLSLKGHAGAVRSVAWSPDGGRLASASRDQTVKVWDASSGQELLTLTGHAKPVMCVAFSPDGMQLVSSSGEAGKPGEVKLWDAATGQETHTFKEEKGGVSSVVFSRDGKRLASTRELQITIRNVAGREELLTLTGHSRGVTSLAFSPDGQRLASASLDQQIRVWDTNIGREVLTLRGHTGPVTAVVFSADGKRLVSASFDQTVRLWDAADGQELLMFKGHTGPIKSVAISADGERLASGGEDRTVKVWDARTEQESHAFKGHIGAVASVAISADGRRLASAGADKTVKVWEGDSGQELLTLNGHTAAVNGVAFSADGQRLASASGDKTVKIWDANNGRELLTFKGHTGPVNCVAMSRERKWLASAGFDQTVKVWDAASGQEQFTLRGHTNEITNLAFSTDGNHLVSGSVDRMVKVWDVSSGLETRTLAGHAGPVWSVAFSADGKRIASASADRTVKVWDLATGQELLTLKGHTGMVWSVAFSPDGQRLTSAGDYRDKTVKLWDATTGQETLTLKGHTGAIVSVAFSANGKRLASASHDGTVRLWDATPRNRDGVEQQAGLSGGTKSQPRSVGAKQ
jgi:eukaryotic-like serine/threonine-protein kinase